MKIASKSLTGLTALFFCGAAASQTAPAPSAALHLTVNYPSNSVVGPMFGTLPKDVALLEVTACNDTPSSLVVANGRIVQALRRSGIQALSRDAAISTMQNSENRNWQSVLLRNSTHAMNIVNFLVISKAVSLGPALSNILPSAQALLEAVVPEFGKDVPQNQYLNFDRDALPDKTQLSPLDCATGLMFTLKPAAQNAQIADLVVEVPIVISAPAPAATTAPAPAAPGTPASVAK